MNPGLTLLKHAVLRRNKQNLSDHFFHGTCRASGLLFHSADSAARFEHRPAGFAARGKFTGLLRGLPAGGPYNIKLTIETPSGRVPEQCTVEDILAGDLRILGGQSNMQGCGYMPGLVPPQSHAP